MCLVQGYSQQKAFIVAQVPLVKTQSDFWSMIWEQNSHVISLLTQPEENDKVCVHVDVIGDVMSGKALVAMVIW